MSDKITRKTALQLAIQAVQTSDVILDKGKVIEKLQLCIDELPFSKWTKAAIFDACDQYIQDTGKPLILNDFYTGRLPSHMVIQRRFGMTAKEFRDKYYPLPGNARSPYCDVTKKQLLKLFAKDYRRVSPKSATAYFPNRDKSIIPCQVILYKLVGAKGWFDLLDMCGIQYTRCRRKSTNTTYTIERHIPSDDKLKEVDKRIASLSAKTKNA